MTTTIDQKLQAVFTGEQSGIRHYAVQDGARRFEQQIQDRYVFCDCDEFKAEHYRHYPKVSDVAHHCPHLSAVVSLELRRFIGEQQDAWRRRQPDVSQPSILEACQELYDGLEEEPLLTCPYAGCGLPVEEMPTESGRGLGVALLCEEHGDVTRAVEAEAR